MTDQPRRGGRFAAKPTVKVAAGKRTTASERESMVKERRIARIQELEAEVSTLNARIQSMFTAQATSDAQHKATIQKNIELTALNNDLRDKLMEASMQISSMQGYMRCMDDHEPLPRQHTEQVLEEGQRSRGSYFHPNFDEPSTNSAVNESVRSGIYGRGTDASQRPVRWYHRR